MIIFLYNFKFLLRSFLWITCVLTSLVWLTQAFRVLDLIVNRGVRFLDFFYVAALLVPSLVFLLLPVSMCIAVLYTLHHMQSEREMIAYKALGLSPSSVVRPIIVLATIVTLLSYANSFAILPMSYKAFKDMQTHFKQNYSAFFLQEGVFNTQIPNLTIYVAQKSHKSLNGILVYDARNPKRSMALTAAAGKMINTKSGLTLELVKGMHQEKNLATNQFSMLKFDHYVFKLDLNQESDVKRVRDPNELNILRLYEDIYVHTTYTSKTLANFHQRITWPMYAFILSWFAAVLILNKPHSKVYDAKQYYAVGVFAAIALFLAVYWNHLMQKHYFAIYLLYANHAAVIICAKWYLRKKGNAV